MATQKRRIILDTSSIVFALSNGIDIFGAVRDQKPGYVPILSHGIVGELKGIRSKGGKYSGYAGAAIGILERSDVEMMPDNSTVDDWIYEEAVNNGYAVCTNDIRLKKRLKARRVTVFSIARSGTIR